MEPGAKKPRLEVISKQHVAKELAESRMVLFQQYENGEVEEVLKAIKNDRRSLKDNKSNAKRFFEEDAEKFWRYEAFFNALANAMLADATKCNPQAFECLHEVMKLLTTACVSSTVSTKSTSTELFGSKSKANAVPKLFTRMLESGDRLQSTTKVLLLDFITGLCTRKEGSLVLCASSALVDQCCLLISSPVVEIQNAALSMFIHVCRARRFLRAFINSNGGHNAGELLARKSFSELILQETKLLTLYETITAVDKRTFGRQQAISSGVPTLIELLFTKDTNPVIQRWHKLILEILMNSFELRSAFGQATLKRAVRDFDNSDAKLKYLCICAQDALSRQSLRLTGGLTLIMKECGNSFDSKSFLIAKNLRYFMHDAEGLAAICRNQEFLDKILHLLQKYCSENASIKCSASENRIALRPDSPNFLIHLKESRQNLNATNFHCDFAELASALPSASSSPRHPSTWRTNWSPAASHTSHSPSPSPPPMRSNFSDSDSGDSDVWSNNPNNAGDNAYSDFEEGEDEETSAVSMAERRDKMGPYLLDVIDWFTHNPENHTQLLQKPVFETLVMIVSTFLPVSAVERAGRSIKRLIRSSECLPYILNMKLHLHVIRSLIRRPCLMHRYGERCSRCEYRRSFGREVIQELSIQANSAPGWNFLEGLLKSEDLDTRFHAWTTGVTLIRTLQFRMRLNTYFDAMNNLLETLKYLMKKAGSNLAELNESQNNTETVHAGITAAFNEDFAKLEAIMFSFAAVISHKIHSDILENQTDQGGFDAQFHEGVCQLEASKIEPGKQLRFVNEAGDHLVTVDREVISQNCEYYRGMFENNFSEKLENQQQFTFQNEGMHITEAQFVKFLHLISGCERSPCVSSDTSTCVALIYLADKYLATELLDSMFSSTGIAGRFLTGSTLAAFAPTLVTALSTHGRFSDLFFFVLLRYASMDEIIETLATLVLYRAEDSFCDLFKEFLERCVKSLPEHPSYRVWI